MIRRVAEKGIQLIAVSRVTGRANIDRLVGGAGEETMAGLQAPLPQRIGFG